MARETTPAQGARKGETGYTPPTGARPEGGTAQAAPETTERERAISTGREGMAPRRPETGRGEVAGRGYASPFNVMQRLADDMDNLFSQFGFGRMGLRPMLGREWTEMEPAWTPQVDVSQKEDRIVVRADLPGVKKEDVHVDVENDMLTIRGERRDEREEKEKGYYRSERSYGSFYRALPLPEGVDPNRCEATYKDGVLEINVPTPKREEAKGRRIEIH